MHDMHMLLNMMRYDALNIAICPAFRMQVAEALYNSQSLTLSEGRTRFRRPVPFTTCCHGCPLLCMLHAGGRGSERFPVPDA